MRRSIHAIFQNRFHSLQRAILRRAACAVSDADELRLEFVELLAHGDEFLSSLGRFRWEEFETDGRFVHDDAFMACTKNSRLPSPPEIGLSK